MIGDLRIVDRYLRAEMREEPATLRTPGLATNFGIFSNGLPVRQTLTRPAAMDCWHRVTNFDRLSIGRPVPFFQWLHATPYRNRYQMFSRCKLYSLIGIVVFAAGCAAPTEGATSDAPDGTESETKEESVKETAEGLTTEGADESDRVLEADSAEAIAAGAPAGCAIYYNTPYYKNGRIYAHTSVSCSSKKSTIFVRAYLSRDNQFAADDDNTCYNASYCSATASAANRVGNQRWCTSGVGNVNSGSPFSKPQLCENQGF